MILYHGSNVVVDQPQILQSERMLDFGMGFYTTSNKEQAIWWAQRVAIRRKTNTRIISEYEFDLGIAQKELSVISFGKPDDEWLDFVCQNRSGKIPSKAYDIAIGPVANDQVFAVVALYEQGFYSKAAAIAEMKVRTLYNQILFHTEKSLDYCRYTRFIEIGGTSSGKK